jgi:hypothetical protein
MYLVIVLLIVLGSLLFSGDNRREAIHTPMPVTGVLLFAVFLVLVFAILIGAFS